MQAHYTPEKEKGMGRGGGNGSNGSLLPFQPLIIDQPNIKKTLSQGSDAKQKRHNHPRSAYRSKRTRSRLGCSEIDVPKIKTG